MNTLMYVVAAVVLTMGATSVGFVIMQSRKNGSKEIPWDKIRPILSEMFVEIQVLIAAHAAGYKQVEDYAVSYIKRKIDQASFLSKEEKALLSEDFIRAVVAPRLKELYDLEQQKR